MAIDDLRVFLSTTKNLVNLNKEHLNIDDKLKKIEYPICSSCTYVPLLGQPDEVCQGLADFLISGAKALFIDTEKRTVFIGDQSKKMSTCLLYYESNKYDKYGEEFFKRWDEIRSLVFEYNAISCPPDKIHLVNKYITFITIRGLWYNNKWSWLRREKSPAFLIANKE